MHSPIPEEFQRRPFSVAHGRDAGIGVGRLRASDLARPFWGVRSTMASDSVEAVAAAWATRMPDHAFFSHHTAAQLWGIPLPLGLSSPLPVHVSMPTELRGPTAQHLRGHHLQIDPRDVRQSGILRLTSLERTVFDLAGALDDEALLAALDNIMWRRRPDGHRASKGSIAAAFARFSGRRGRARLRELMPLASSRADAAPESAFRLRFLRAGFPPALANESILDATGWPVATPDLQIYDFRMAFDYEGDGHRTDKRQWRKDLKRVPRIQDAGWHHTRLSGDDLADPTEMLQRTARLLRERGWRGPLS